MRVTPPRRGRRAALLLALHGAGSGGAPDGVDLTGRPYEERRSELGQLGLDGIGWATTEAFDDGRALFAAVCELGFEGVVAKQHSSLYRPNDRGWVKVKNPNYWRRGRGA